MKDFFTKNLQALKEVHSPLVEAIGQISTNSRFELFQGDDTSEINILDLQLERWVHQSAANELHAKTEEMQQYREFPFLYLFGIGNGLLIKHLLENEKHKQIAVIEPEPEMLYIALNLIDISRDILTKRVVLLTPELLTFSRAIEIFHSSNAKFYFRVFALHTACDYYLNERFETYKRVHDQCIKVMSHIAKAFGNDIADSLLGLRHHIRNLPRMVKHPKYKQLLAKRNSDLAIIVSTGPSLYKQLDLLKAAADRVTIISVDASLPILVKHGIKPDIVVSMERDEPTSKFFKDTPDEDHKDIIFLCASLQHTSVYESIHGGTTLLVMRPFPYNIYFQLHDFGYVCAGMSAANMAHEVAFQMGFGTCAFIGQDLAYGADGTSHSKGHVFGEAQIKDGVDTADNNVTYDTIEIPAYGNRGMVKSMPIWQIFQRFIEQTIDQTKEQMTSINATEGGAHIEGSVEMPFSDVLGQYAVKTPKEPITLTFPDSEEMCDNMAKVRDSIRAIITEGRQLQANIEEAFLVVAKACEKLEGLDMERALKIFDIGETMLLLDTISNIRKHIEESPIYNAFFVNITQSILYVQEMKLAEIKVMYVDNPTTNQTKALQWILEHRYWLFSLGGAIDNILSVVEEESRSYRD